jgi:putative membrane protein
MWGTNLSQLGGNYCGWGASFGHGPWFLGWLLPLLFWGFVAYFIINIVRHFFSRKPSDQNDGAFDILRKRYASGEIDEKEYATRKEILSSR